RWNANNSAVLAGGRLTQLEFIQKFLEMVESGRGEPGIFNREAALAMRPARRTRRSSGRTRALRETHGSRWPMGVGACV
ncbi:MAG: hypothetical protein HC884_15200, partial [Chloroflexaceae bacterium]|nr:hypothetical protein [Chloroflexaceae bacterium]